MGHLSLALSLSLFIAVPNLSDAEVLFTLTSPNEEMDGWFGYSAAGVGDVDQDGFDDFVLGTFGEDPYPSPHNAGRAYVYSGTDGGVLHQLASPYEEEGGKFGMAVAGAGDVNSDGHPDIIVGACYEDPTPATLGAGRAYVFSGATADVLHVLDTPNPENQGNFGWSVSGAGDSDGDGYGDIIVGAYAEDPGASEGDAGRAYVFSGQSGALLHTLVSPNDQWAGYFGSSVCSIGDLDNDGAADLVVGAFGEDDRPYHADLVGKVHVFSGSTGEVIFSISPPSGQRMGLFGDIVRSAGDVDKDGLEDFVVGAQGAGPESVSDFAGKAYVFSSQTGELLFELVSPEEESQSFFAAAVSGAGDVNGDGYSDVFVGEFGADPGNEPANSGRAHIFSGKTGSLLSTLTSPNPESHGNFGWAVSYVGHVASGDGTGFLISASRESTGTSPEGAGRAYVFTDIPVGADESNSAIPKHLVVEGPFPNPTTDWALLHIRNRSASAQRATVALCDMNGRRILTLLTGSVDGEREMNVRWRRTEQIAAGLYWWTIRLGSRVENRPMIVLR